MLLISGSDNSSKTWAVGVGWVAIVACCPLGFNAVRHLMHALLHHLDMRACVLFYVAATWARDEHESVRYFSTYVLFYVIAATLSRVSS